MIIIIIHTPTFMILSSWSKPLREFTRFIWWMPTEQGVAAKPQTKPTHLGCESANINGCYHPHPPSPFVIITQPESWYSFYCPTEGGRLSWPRHCSKGAQLMAVHRSGCHDKHNCPQALTPQSVMPPLNHCDLPRHMGVNNLPKVVTQQRHGRELNSQVQHSNH